MALKEFELQVINRVPNELVEGILYVCFDCNVVVHLCACGCGAKVVLPIDPDFWSITYNGEAVSMMPSIGNFQFPCKSHYWIRENKIVWAEAHVQTSNNRRARKQKKKNWKDMLKRLF